MPLRDIASLGLMASAEEEALDRHKLLRIIHAMVDAVLVFDAEGHVLLCNPAFEKTFGMTQASILGKPLKALFDTTMPELPEVISELIHSGEPFSHEVSFHQSPQKKVFLLSTIPIEENGQYTEGVAVFHDITEVKQTEKMRRDFVANVSHELRTPLSAIHGYAETLLEGALDDQAVAREFVQVIFNHSKRLSQLVRDLLDLSKLESSESPFELTSSELSPILEKVIQLHQKDLKKKELTLSYEKSEALPCVLAHESSLEQVITNLLDNAVKYTPNGQAIAIRVRLRDAHIQVDVEDTGIGIESKHIPRLFERFYRVDKARSRDLGGTGLGLAIVKHIIQSHGGDVWVNSAPGKGTTFSFTLQTAP